MLEFLKASIKNGYLLILFMICLSRVLFGQNYYEEGVKKYFDHSDINISIDLFTKAIANKQEVAKSYMMRGAAEGKAGYFGLAFNDLDSSKKLDTTNFKLFFYYGRLSLLEGSYAPAKKYYSVAISKNPGDADSYDDRASAEGLMGEYVNALADENTAIKIDSSNDAYYNNRGLEELLLKQYDYALKDFNISLKIKPNKKAYINKGSLFAGKGMYREAIIEYDSGLSITPEDPLVIYYRGGCYKALGEIDKACEDFNKSSKMGCMKAVLEAGNCSTLQKK